MGKKSIAQAVLDAVGGRENVTDSDVCMTRLRLTLADRDLASRDDLDQIPEVLGTVIRGSDGIEIVFGPRTIEGVYNALDQLVKNGTDTEGSPANEPSDDEDEASASQAETPNPAEATQQTSKAAAAPKDEGTPQPSRQVPEEPARTAPFSHPSQKRPTVKVTPVHKPAPQPTDDDLNQLANLLDQTRTSTAMRIHGPRVLVINGPNINMLGIREPDIYGHNSFSALLALCHRAADEAGFSKCTCFQSNHEGDLVDQIQDAYGMYDGIVINPGAYTHTSVAILDALKAVSIPAVEVHISQLDKREEFRQISYVRAACFETVIGMGIEGYRKAIMDLAKHLGVQPKGDPDAK
ncbi:MAG: type II 3-dehydroquinate dehydratase [Atopobiaceae bacterium]